MMSKGEFLLYHDRIVEAQALEELTEVVHDLMHEEYGEARDALFALAMANKRILYNIHYFDAVNQSSPAAVPKRTTKIAGASRKRR